MTGKPRTIYVKVRKPPKVRDLERRLSEASKAVDTAVAARTEAERQIEELRAKVARYSELLVSHRELMNLLRNPHVDAPTYLQDYWRAVMLRAEGLNPSTRRHEV